MTAPLVFLDTETTGLRLDDEVWEIAAVRRDWTGTETVLHLFVMHDLAKAEGLPDSFRADHDARYFAAEPVQPEVAAAKLAAFIGQPEQYDDRAHIVGCVPNFDTEHLARMLRAHGRQPGWHHHLIDVENLAVGWLRAKLSSHGFKGAPGAWSFMTASRVAELVYDLPWDSDAVSEALGVTPPGDGVRHTAMGDVRWAMAIYDAVMGGDRG